MAKKSKIVANEKRRALVERYRERRDALRAATKESSLSPEEREAAMRALARLPRDSSPSGCGTGIRWTADPAATSAKPVSPGSTSATPHTEASFRGSRSRAGKRYLRDLSALRSG